MRMACLGFYEQVLCIYYSVTTGLIAEVSFCDGISSVRKTHTFTPYLYMLILVF